MLYTIKKWIQYCVPESLILLYHQFIAHCAARWYGYPSREMLVIGVTGTNGKSTTCHLIARILDATGYKVGLASTVEFQIGSQKWLNSSKMTMLGRFALQKLLREMVDAEVKYAIIEVSSQGIMQHRTDGIDFDIAVFTNLTPEHIEAHGSFENYKKEKGKLFFGLRKSLKKTSITQGNKEVVSADVTWETRKVSEKICKTIIVNGDDALADYFLSFDAQEKYSFHVEGKGTVKNDSNGARSITATHIELSDTHTSFRIGSSSFHLNLPGVYNVYNALAAITVGLTRGMEFSLLTKVLAEPMQVPGRFERIFEGQNFSVIVDYAPEPASLSCLYGVINTMKKNRVIHVLGSCGGGRDRDRRDVLGRIAGTSADIVIVTNEDPYDDEPMEIINAVAGGSRAVGKKDNENLFIIEDRKQAIEKAISMAQHTDVVLITGKGAEQAMCVAGGRKILWDDREIAREALKKRESIIHN